MLSFKQNFDFEKRKTESSKIREKYPDKYPVIAEKGKNSKLMQADKTKFLVHKNDLFKLCVSFNFLNRKQEFNLFNKNFSSIK